MVLVYVYVQFGTPRRICGATRSPQLSGSKCATLLIVVQIVRVEPWKSIKLLLLLFFQHKFFAWHSLSL